MVLHMTKGFLVLAQNSSTDYIKQAYVLALSIKKTQPTFNNISLVTDDIVPEEYQKVFDKILPIPFGDHAVDKEWKIENRWKLYHATPYDETIVLDADMLFLENMEHLWDFAKDRELFFTSHVKDYKGRTVVDTVYRKTFIENDLPNLYSGLYYFKKSDKNLKFFKLLEFITYNWEQVYYTITPKQTQKFYSLDVTISIAAKILGNDDQIQLPNSPFSFVHMKPGIQGWDPYPESYLKQTLVNFNNNFELYFNNFKQCGIVHYVEDEFLTDKILERLHV
jgi:hypothetical protein